MFVPIAKEDDPQAKKRREVNIGLANNATGAAFGTVATGQALQFARAKMRDPNAPEPTKLSVRAGRAVARKFPSVGRAANRLKPKSGKKALLALGAVNVGGQALNAGLDAQSMSYFARERKSLSRQKNDRVVKSDNGLGTFYERVSKRDAWVDPEVRRQRQLSAVSTGAGLLGTGSIVYGSRNFLNAPSHSGQHAVVHTMKLPGPKVQNAQGKKVNGPWVPREIPVRGPDGEIMVYRDHPKTIGGNIRQGIRNARKPVNIPPGTSRTAAMGMRLRSPKGKIAAPLATGAALLGVSGGAYRLGHGKNERPWR